MKYKTLFRLMLKAIGVWLAASAASAVVTNVALFVAFFVGSGAVGLAPIPYRIASFVGPLAELGIGVYLFFGGGSIADRAIPSNRPYCHECGYELTGATGHVCPECGTPFRVPDQPGSASESAT